MLAKAAGELIDELAAGERTRRAFGHERVDDASTPSG